MTTAVYQPSTGLVALDAPTLAAILDHARGRRLEPAARRSLVDAGMVADDGLDPPLRRIVAPLLASGPRLRLLSRARGRLTVTDAAYAPDDHAGGATVVVRPPESDVLHLRHARAGTVTRVVAAGVGLGPHVLADPPFRQPLDLRDWGIVRSAFESVTPSGWVGRRRHAELHELRWAPAPGVSAATAVVIAQLDGGLAEIRPRDAGDDVFTVTAADTTAVWRRLCALTTGGGAPRGGYPTTTPTGMRRRDRA